MAPKKQSIKKPIRLLMEKYDISFEGPLPPQEWPPSNRDLFAKIRRIWGTRYDEYIDEKIKEHQACRELGVSKTVDTLRKRAYQLRMDDKTAESTWRTYIEGVVRDAFSASHKCPACGLETWTLDYQAEPQEEDERQKLYRRRARRQRCQCTESSNMSKDKRSKSDGDDRGGVFRFVTDCTITQDPEISEEKITGIPMKPDLIMGLTMIDRFRQHLESTPQDLTPCPIEGVHLMYPFMIFEAKREEDSNGFRDIEIQSAFALYRVLKIQDDLRKRYEHHKPLVWFFGSHGDEWRLYACVMEEGKMRVFDLWLGTIESHDGALQLLQIMEYIWTWAYDIYRPSIKKCFDDTRLLRSVSPSSADAFSREQSMMPIASLQARLSDTVEWEMTLSAVDTLPRSHQGEDMATYPNHPLSRWIETEDGDTLAHSQTSIRSSNVVSLSFRVFELPSTKESFQHLLRSLGDNSDQRRAISHILALLDQRNIGLPLFIENLATIKAEWVGTDLPTSSATVAESSLALRAFFFVRTHLQRNDWKIKRELYCLLWSIESVKSFYQLTGHRLSAGSLDYTTTHLNARGTQETIIQELRRVRGWAGLTSVKYAVQERTFLLLRSHEMSPQLLGYTGMLAWTPLSSDAIEPLQLYRRLFETPRPSGGLLTNLSGTTERLLWVQEPNSRPVNGTHSPLTDAEAQTDALLVVDRDVREPRERRFCLFVLIDRELSGRQLGDLLVKAVKNVYDIDADYTDTDKRNFQRWLKGLQAHA